jgi:hypothetical protein
MITQERLKELFEYEEDTGRLRRIKNLRELSGGGKGAIGTYPTYICNSGYLQVRIDKRLCLVHRLVYLYHTGKLPELLDHINMDKLDNRIANLREASKSQNGQNSKKQSNNTSGTKGLSYNVTNKAWQVQILANSKRVAYKSFKGSIDDETIKQEAILWANTARQQHHGEFANNG